MREYRAGIDAGFTTVKQVVLEKKRRDLFDSYCQYYALGASKVNQLNRCFPWQRKALQLEDKPLAGVK